MDKSGCVDKVNFRQFLCLAFIAAIAMKMFMLPVLIMRVSGRDSFFVMVFAMAADLALLLIVAAVIHLAGDKNLFELLSETFGKIVTRIILAAVSVFYLFKLFVILVDVRIFFSTSVFASSMSPVHLLPLVVLMLYFAFKPISVTGRVSELITPMVIVSMIVLCCMTLPEVDLSNLLPFVGEGWDNVLTSMFSFTMWFGDFSMLLILTGKVNKGGKKVYFSLIAALVGFAFLLVFASVLFSAYGDMTEVLTYGHNISNMTQYGAGSFKYGRIDLIIYCMWLTAVLLSAGFMMIFFTRAMSFSFGQKAGKWLTVAAGAAIFGVILWMTELNLVTEFMTHNFWIPSIAVQYGFPPLCMAAVIVSKAKEKLRKRRAYDKAEQKG